MKKSTKTEYIPVRVEPELKEWLAAAADFEGVTMSEMVRRLISQVHVIGYIKDGKVIRKDDEK